MRWPWSKDKEDDSWEALDESRKMLNRTRSQWTDVNEVVVEAHIAAAQVRSQRKENNFRVMMLSLMDGGHK